MKSRFKRGERDLTDSDELRHQDVLLRRIVVDCCGRYGLIVVGYSGRDDSIMDALEETLEEDASYPRGLFWALLSLPWVIWRAEEVRTPLCF